MQDIFKGFLVLRLIGLLVLLIVAGAVVGTVSVVRGSDVLGVAILAGVVVCAAAAWSLVARRRASRRPQAIPRSGSGVNG